MKSAICKEPRNIIIEEIEPPKIDENEVLVKVRSAGISALDVLAYMGLYPAIYYPITLGHQFSGEVSAIGKNVDNVAIGDNVIVEPLMPCKKCQSCLSGNQNLCQNLKMMGYNIPGAFSEYVSANASLVYRSDKDLSFEEACLIEPLAVSIHAIKEIGVGIGDVVVIMGGGSTGLITLQSAKRSGASAVVMDKIMDRLHFAADLEADYVINPSVNDASELVMAITKGAGSAYVLECTGDPFYLEKAFDFVCSGGTVAMIEPLGNKPIQLPLATITMNGIKLIGFTTYVGDLSIAIDLVNSGAINLNSIISHRFSLSNIGEAFEKLSQCQEDIIKAVINF
ncbi:MAG: alcohol dehydrogenase catalytic domain-containing protein [Candidatus Poribacteria bacterium]